MASEKIQKDDNNKVLVADRGMRPVQIKGEQKASALLDCQSASGPYRVHGLDYCCSLTRDESWCSHR